MHVVDIGYYPIGSKVYCLSKHSIRWFNVQKIVIVMTKGKVHMAYIDENGKEEFAENISDNIEHIIRTLEGRECETGK